ncbi:Ig-like protein group 2 [Bacteroides zoogleoformans]|uniref:Carbohydrate-binding protein n=1 Tax=Bacteroides zoogleoformans TaxID=28119 RepID=A0ABM6T693_9BACE|nr:discoidin domain-containing protein [Bacteroides zoogleoformans]AVM52258.1 carbohydrate-binding protein [Bacteroides zoogleoformans]TWJ10921.1 Ig-like protein group 2 [Bacteroides zoogleoformans]
MKKNIYILLGMFSFGALFAGCDDDDFGKAVTITAKNATNLESDIFGVVVTEGQPLQLKPFIMPKSARKNTVSYHFAGEPTGAIDLSEDGLITPKLTTPATGDIPSPLGTDTIIIRVDDGSSTYVRYPVRVVSNIVLVSSITIQSAGQNVEVERGKTFNLAQYVTVNPDNATDKSVTYSSEDPTVAIINRNGIITVVGETGQSTKITITANDRGRQTATCRVKVAAEAPLYVGFPFSEKWSYSCNLGTKEGNMKNLFDDKNSTFWCPEITMRPVYDPVCYLDIDLGEVIRLGQLGYRHRSLNYSHLQCHTFRLEAKKTVGDTWIDLGECVTESLKVEDYQFFPVEPIEARYIRITFIKGHLRSGQADWNYSENGNVSVGDLQVFIYNR